MKKLIKISLENTTNSRQIDETFCEYYSHDRNNGLFEFEITNTTLTTEKVTALFKFTRSKSYWTTDGVIEGNKIKVKFDTSLITQNEVVECHLYLDNTDEDADVFSFKFNVKISELDRAKNKPIKERYFANSMIVDVDNVLTREVLNEEIKTLKETFVNNETFPRLVEDELNKKNFITDISNLATKDAVDEVAKKVTKLEERPSYDDSDVKQRLTALEGANFLTEHQNISNLATKQSVDDVASKVTQLEARPSYDDSEIKRKLKELEDRPATANIDTSNFVTTTQLEDKHYLTEHQSLAGYVTETQLEGKNYLTEHQDISKLATKEQLDELRNSRPTVDTSDLVTKEQLRKAFLDDEEHEKYAKKSELPQPYNDTDIKSRLSTLENKPSGSGSELRGHGFPTGKDAPIGTTYIDEDVTNGALKWIKTKTGWKVIEGDTGWVDIVTSYMFTGSKIQLRRINNIVHVKVTNGTTEGLIRFNNLYDANTTTRYLKVFNGMASFGWRPTTPQVQIIFPEVTQGGDDYTYNTSTPQQYIRFRTDITGLKIELFLEEFAVTNNGLGVYINSFSYLTDDDWAIFITTIS
jgi:hypothetical protein